MMGGKAVCSHPSRSTFTVGSLRAIRPARRITSSTLEQFVADIESFYAQITRMALTYLQTCSLAPVTLEALLLGFSEHYPAGAHLEMFVDQRKMAELRCLFTLAGHTLCTEGLVAMLALTAK